LKLRCSTGLGGNCFTGMSFTTGVMNWFQAQAAWLLAPPVSWLLS
jgi:hypothetical protein